MDATTSLVLKARARRLALHLGAPERTAEDRHMLAFSVGSVDYAVPIGGVVEVRDRVRIEPVPGMPHWIAGLIGVRGRVVAAARTDAFLGVRQPESTAAHAIVLRTGGNELALLGSAITGVVRVPAELSPLPDGIPDQVRNCALGFLGQRLVIDPGRLVAAMRGALGQTRLESSSSTPSKPE